MARAKTTPRQIDGLTINVPVGSLDTPSEQTQAILKASHDPRGWKYPLSPYHTFDASLADDLAYCYDFYLGGHERAEIDTPRGTLYEVTSKGYYHYIGA